MRRNKKTMFYGLALAMAMSMGAAFSAPSINANAAENSAAGAIYSTASNLVSELNDLDAGETSAGEDEVTNDNYEAGTVTYDASTFSTFKSRTKQEVVEKYAAAYYAGKTYVNSDRTSYYSVQASTVAPYNKGVLSDDTQTVMTAMTNYCRWLTGSNNVTVASSNSSTYAASMQAQALDRNFEFNHYISNTSKPADMDDATWNEGYSCTHNILASGYTPAGAIVGWLNEGYSISSGTWGTVGHRDAIIGPKVSNIQYGYCGRIGIGKIVSSTNTFKEAFTAYPAPGYMPSDMITGYETAWGVYLDTTKIKNANTSGIVVKVTNLTTGNMETWTSANDGVKAGTGYVNFIQPSDYTNYRYTDSYKVEITGLTDVATGNAAKIVYQVEFFDAKANMTAPVKSVAAFASKICMPSSITAAELNVIAKNLPKNLTVTNDQSQTYNITAAGAWTYDATNKCFVNSASTTQLPSNMNDTWGKLKRITIPVEVVADDTTSVRAISFSNAAVKPGGSTRLSVYHPYMYNSSYVYRTLVYQVSGSSVKLRFDSSTSSEFDAEASANSSYYHYYNIENAKDSDNGDYISMYYLESSSSIAYISKPQTFEVREIGAITKLYGPYSNIAVNSTNKNAEYLSSIARAIPHTATLYSDFGDTAVVETVGAWTYDADLGLFVNKVNKNADLPDNFIYRNGILDQQITMGVTTSSTVDSQNISADKTLVKTGGSVTITANGYYTNYSYASVAHIASNPANDKFWNNDSEECITKGSSSARFQINNLELSDGGRYVAIMCSPTASVTSKYGYVVTKELNLEVRDYGNVTDAYGPFKTIYVYSTMSDETSMQKVAAAIPSVVKLELDVGEVVEVPTVGGWTYDSTSAAFVAKIDKTKLPASVKDPDGILNGEISIAYAASPNSYYRMSISPTSCAAGSKVTYSMNIYSSGYPASKVYRITEAAGKYSGALVFDSETSAEYVEGSSVFNHSFVVDSVDESYSGEYIAFYVKPTDNSKSKVAYVASSISKLQVEHNYIETVVNEANCIKKKTIKYECVGCGDTYQEEVGELDKSVHPADKIINVPEKAPTCTAAGYTAYSYCSGCSTNLSEKKTLNALGHDYSYTTSWNSDYSECYLTVTCANDATHGIKNTKMTVTYPQTVASTCVTRGTVYCEAKYTYGGVTYKANDSYKLDLDPNNHKSSSIVIDKAVAVTCTTAGKTEGKHCADCNAVLVAQKTINAIGHDYEPTFTWNDSNRTCTMSVTCNNDSTHKISNIATDVEVVESKDETCMATGYVRLTCAGEVGKDTFIDSHMIVIPIDKTKHPKANIVTDPAVAVDCKTNGLTEGSHCSLCNAVIVKQNVINALGHDLTVTYDWNEVALTNRITITCANNSSHNVTKANMKVTKVKEVASTCVDEGYIEYKCTYTYDGTEYSDIRRVGLPLDISNHPEDKIYMHDYVEPTCTEDGYTSGTECLACGKAIDSQKVIPKLGHQYVTFARWNIDDPENITSEVVYACARDASHAVFVPAEVVLSKTVAPGCETEGYKEYTAAAIHDGNEHSETMKVPIAATGHALSAEYEWVENEIEGEKLVCKITVHCANDEHHDISNMEMDVNVYKKVLSTCVKTGKTEYFSTYTYLGKTFQSEYSEIRGIDLDNHPAANIETIKGYEATCDKDGLSDYHHCSACDNDIDEPEVIKALGHKYEKIVDSKALKSAATYDSPAIYYYTCSRCGKVDKSENAATFTSGSKLEKPEQVPDVTVWYTTHVQSFGWQGDENNSATWKKNGEMAGTSGLAKRLEGIKIKVSGNPNLGIEYRTHIQTYGWETSYKANGDMSGTSGQAKRLEAISIRLTGADKDKYDIYYRVHAQSYGWLGWAKNGENAGTAAQAKRLEGIEIVVLKKGQVPSTGTVGYSYIELGKASTNGKSDGMVNYMTHVQSYGDQNYVYDGSVSGTFGEAKRLEGIRVNINNDKTGVSGGIMYTTQVQTYGWLGDKDDPSTWNKDGEFCGTHGEAKRLEAIKIKLYGEMADKYDVYYRVHSQTYGWLGWAKNGEAAGTVGLAKRLEGIQIVLVPKDKNGNTEVPNHLPGKAGQPACISK